MDVEGSTQPADPHPYAIGDIRGWIGRLQQVNERFYTTNVAPGHMSGSGASMKADRMALLCAIFHSRARKSVQWMQVWWQIIQKSSFNNWAEFNQAKCAEPIEYLSFIYDTAPWNSGHVLNRIMSRIPIALAHIWHILIIRSRPLPGLKHLELKSIRNFLDSQSDWYFVWALSILWDSYFQGINIVWAFHILRGALNWIGILRGSHFLGSFVELPSFQEYLLGRYFWFSFSGVCMIWWYFLGFVWSDICVSWILFGGADFLGLYLRFVFSGILCKESLLCRKLLALLRIITYYQGRCGILYLSYEQVCGFQIGAEYKT